MVVAGGSFTQSRRRHEPAEARFWALAMATGCKTDCGTCRNFPHALGGLLQDTVRNLSRFFDAYLVARSNAELVRFFGDPICCETKRGACYDAGNSLLGMVR